jgi:hypothetical protein
MATSSEISVGGILLFVNIFADVVLYYIGDVLLAPLLDILSAWPIHPALKESLWELTYIAYLPFAMMLIFAILSIVAFVMIIARRQVSPFDY